MSRHLRSVRNQGGVGQRVLEAVVELNGEGGVTPAGEEIVAIELDIDLEALLLLRAKGLSGDEFRTSNPPGVVRAPLGAPLYKGVSDLLAVAVHRFLAFAVCPGLKTLDVLHQSGGGVVLVLLVVRPSL